MKFCPNYCQYQLFLAMFFSPFSSVYTIWLFCFFPRDFSPSLLLWCLTVMPLGVFQGCISCCVHCHMHFSLWATAKRIFYILSFVKVSVMQIRTGVCFTLLPITIRSKNTVKAYRFIQRKHWLTNSQMSFNYGLLRKQLARVNNSFFLSFLFIIFNLGFLTTSWWIW